MVLFRSRFFAVYAGRSLAIMRGWEFGFLLAPWPDGEVGQGMMRPALWRLHGHACFSPWRLSVWNWFDDPEARPVGHNSPLATKDT